MLSNIRENLGLALVTVRPVNIKSYESVAALEHETSSKSAKWF